MQNNNQSHNLVAVYGSLKKGFGNHRLLSDSTFITDAVSLNDFTMLSLGSFPCITHVPSTKIQVEIYSVTDETFENLDRLEGHPHFYKREKQFFEGKGMEFTAWIYFIANEDRYSSVSTDNPSNLLAIWTTDYSVHIKEIQ